jgi:ribosomal protein S18 acetylase RimI-like enzyme
VGAADNPGLRDARVSDARRIAELIDLAGEGIPLWLWAQDASGDQTPLDFGALRAAREGVNFSFRNAVVAEIGEQVVGMMLGYRLPDSTGSGDLWELPSIVRPMVELELMVPGSFYINALAVLPDFQGSGIGSRLLEIANERGRAAGCKLLSLIVFEENRDAVRLYLQRGYTTAARRPAVSHPCCPLSGEILLMTRQVW